MKNKIIKICNECGIEDIGFCEYSEVSDHLLNCRALGRIPQNAKTIILLLFPYKVKEESPELISRYSSVPDYHRVCDQYLTRITEKLKETYSDNKFEWFIDNSPIPEVYSAACAGLGVYGENGLLINERWGSWCFIGEIITDLKIDCKKQLKKCSLCGNCKKACPRGIHGTECLSAVSQKKKELNFDEIKALKSCKIIWGCDICANVCPMNQNAKTTYIKEFIEGYKNSYSKGEDITGRAFEWRGEKVIKRNYEILNATENNDN